MFARPRTGGQGDNMDEFMTALFGAKEVKASAREKRGNETRTVTLAGAIPLDTSDEAFVEAAKMGGVNLSVKVATSEERSKNITGKGVYGAAAINSTASVLGYRPAPTPVPEPVAKRGRSLVPSDNAAAPSDGATPPKKGKGD